MMRNTRLMQIIPEPKSDIKVIRQLVAEITPSICTDSEKNREQIIPKVKAIGIFKNARLTMTIPEFAELTSISKNLAYALARRDKLPVKVIHLGEKRMCLSRKAVMELLDAPAKTENHIESVQK